jgi:hypothetical protein
MKKKCQEQIEAAAKLSVGFGVVCLVLVIFIPTDLGAKCRGALAGLMALGWGSSQLALARKRKKQDSENAGKEDGSNKTKTEQLQDGRMENSWKNSIKVVR